MTRPWGLPKETVEEWKKLLPEYLEKYPPKHSGFSIGCNHAFTAIARDYKVDLKTVYCYLRPYLRSKMARNGYAAKHERLRYHFPNVLHKIFGEDFELPTREIISRISEFSGIKIRKTSLETLLNHYDHHPQGKPLIEIDSDIYTLNGSFYAEQIQWHWNVPKALRDIKN